MFFKQKEMINYNHETPQARLYIYIWRLTALDVLVHVFNGYDL